MARAQAGRRPVTRERLFERALAIIDAGGLEALTMRRLAADVGVEAASLYHHVSGKDELLDGALSLMRSEMVFAEPLPQDWRALMELVFTTYLAVLAAHPNMLPLAGRRVGTDPQSGLVYLVSSGFPEEDAVELWQSINAFTVGFAAFSSAFTTTDTSDLPEGLARRMAQWRETTSRRTLGLIMTGYEPSRRR
ncbi:MAG TPA: TetR family transcriptional regulator [Candidatus Lustribacter sp.]|nr:TetR family transcriptional regulator [Candidatus Lustribacter sp.]